MSQISLWFLIFISYSFLGWMMEVVVGIIQHKKAVNRGFLVGPICPIYGTGALLLSLVLQPSESPIAVFCVSVVGAAVLEYTTSYVMEKLFRVRWWDYTNRPMNLNGRICLEALVGFGLIGVLITKFLTPLFTHIYSNLPLPMLYLISGILFLLLIFDICLSLWLILGVRVTVGTVQRDATGEIAERVHEILTDKSKLNRRLVKAFPNQAPSNKPIHESQKRRKTKPIPH